MVHALFSQSGLLTLKTRGSKYSEIIVLGSRGDLLMMRSRIVMGAG
jgi:hypothetical protein